jgi:protein CpxP
MENLKMKRMINLKAATMLMLLAFLTLPIFAQQGRGQGRQMSEQDIKDNVANLADTLNLTEKQEKEILEYDLKFYQTMQKERQNFDPETSDRDAMRARMIEVRDERDAKYKEVLTKEQFEKYTKITEARRAQMRERRGQGQGSDGEQSRGRGRGGN